MEKLSFLIVLKIYLIIIKVLSVLMLIKSVIYILIINWLIFFYLIDLNTKIERLSKWSRFMDSLKRVDRAYELQQNLFSKKFVHIPCYYLLLLSTICQRSIECYFLSFNKWEIAYASREATWPHALYHYYLHIVYSVTFFQSLSLATSSTTWIHGQPDVSTFFYQFAKNIREKRDVENENEEVRPPY